MAVVKRQSPSRGSSSELFQLRDDAVGVADKTFSVADDVGEGMAVEVLAIRVDYTATATVGVRLVRWSVLDGSGEIVMSDIYPTNLGLNAGEREVTEILPGFYTTSLLGTQGASAPHHPNKMWSPRIVLSDDYRIRVYEQNGWDPTGDSMKVLVRGLVWPDKRGDSGGLV